MKKVNASQGKTENLRIVLIGGYGGGNIGDEAICFVTATLIKQLSPSPELSIVTFNRKVSEGVVKDVDWIEYKNIPFTLFWLRHFGKIYEVKKAAYALKTLMSADRVIVGGGGLFYDHRYTHLLAWSSLILLLRLLGKKYSIYAHSFYRSKKKAAGFLIRWIMKNAEKISVRDPLSEQYCADNGRLDCKITSDPAFALPALVAEKGLRSEKEKKILLAPRPWGKGDANMRAWVALVKVLERYFEGYGVYLLPMDPRMDRKFCDDIRNASGGKCRVLGVNYSDMTGFIEELSSASAVVAMRLHAAILSLAVDTPAVGISYDPKVSGVFMSMGRSGLCMPWEEFVSDGGISRVIEMVRKTEPGEYKVMDHLLEVKNNVMWHIGHG